MRVLVVTNMYPTEERPYYGIFVKEHVEALERLEVEVDTAVTDTSRSRIAYFTAMPKLRAMLSRKRYDVIHVHHTYNVYQVKLAQMLSRTKAPVIITIHEGESLIPEGLRDERADWLKKLVYLKRPKRWALDLTDRVVSVNEPIPMALDYQKPYEIIPPGVNVGLFRPLDKSECRERLGIPQEVPVLFFPADPKNPFKGFSIVEESLPSLPDNLQVLTGGEIAREEMPVYMNAADVVVQVSEFEASPMVVKEAMAVNVPMISTDTGDAKRIFGTTPGYYICEKNAKDVAAKIKQALEFGGRTSGHERFLSIGLSLEQVAQRYLKIYRELIDTAA